MKCNSPLTCLDLQRCYGCFPQCSAQTPCRKTPTSPRGNSPPSTSWDGWYIPTAISVSLFPFMLRSLAEPGVVLGPVVLTHFIDYMLNAVITIQYILYYFYWILQFQNVLLMTSFPVGRFPSEYFHPHRTSLINLLFAKHLLFLQFRVYFLKWYIFIMIQIISPYVPSTDLFLTNNHFL